MYQVTNTPVSDVRGSNNENHTSITQNISEDFNGDIYWKIQMRKTQSINTLAINDTFCKLKIQERQGEYWENTIMTKTRNMTTLTQVKSWHEASTVVTDSLHMARHSEHRLKLDWFQHQWKRMAFFCSQTDLLLCQTNIKNFNSPVFFFPPQCSLNWTVCLTLPG